MWHFHQHGADVTPQGTVILYDNGNYRASPPDPRLVPADSFSRVVEYQIDETAMTVTDVWSYGPSDELFYSGFGCDADRMPITGNVLIADGGHVEEPDGTFSNDVMQHISSARILEVTHDSPATKVLELTIIDPTITTSGGWSIYRADKIESLQP